MRAVSIAALAVTLALAGCAGDGAEPSGDVSPTPTEESTAPERKLRGEIDVAVEPLALDQLPETPAPGTGKAMLGDQEYAFVVDYCDDASPIGTGEGGGVSVAWDLRLEDDDHRVAIILDSGDERWVRAGPAEAEWDPETRTARFAGAFVPFRSEDGSQAKQGGIVVVCPPKG